MIGRLLAIALALLLGWGFGRAWAACRADAACAAARHCLRKTARP
jgi:hypothetical protein